MNRKACIEKNFGSHVAEYEYYAYLQQDIAETLASYLPDIENPKVLEIGCGTGFLTQHLFKKYPDGEFVITDLCPDMVAATENKFDKQGVVYCAMDGENLNLEAKFDLIVSSMSIQWFDNVKKGLKKLEKSLKKGGSLYYSMPGPDSFKQWGKTLESIGHKPGTLPFVKPKGVFEEEMRTIGYPDTFQFLKSIKAIGASQPKKGYKYLTPKKLKRACEIHDEKHDGKITWHILYGKEKA